MTITQDVVTSLYATGGGRRVRQTRISVDLLAKMLTPGKWTDHVRCVSGLPEGARLLDAWVDHTAANLVLLWEHESFPRPTGSAVESLDPSLRTFFCGHKPSEEGTA